ncbi:hypothetical protein WT10_03425 [Burkholderia stagnalis]|nr:hypothetical protein WS59_33220 [Burkholderia stagnalis]KVN17475.1 hypothetical protein WT10_03425 [Burkholderia stagnalis]KWI73583.1 hypothetical protein WT75_09950 [Burkholderia stagnalis]KWN17565.1 hypothetical protein WT84_17190 [Burkholderia stagnalis]KWN27520.1 hypothetical protein WT85_01230 [Burkholderia stagnalis]
MLQPVLCFFDLRQRKRVFTAGKRTGLKRAQTVSDYREQSFVCDAVDADFRDGTVLKFNQCGSVSTLADVTVDCVKVIRAARTGIVKYVDVQFVVCRVDDVIGDRTHRIPF